MTGRPGVRRAAIFGAAGAIDVANLRRLIAAADPRVATFRGRLGAVRLPTGHWAMLSLPGPLAALLHEIAEQ